MSPSSAALPSPAEVAAERARRSLRRYVRDAWHVVEPAARFVPGWHLDAICDHLEAVSAGEIRHLLITMPPRHAKSLSVSVFWPTWEWVTHPERRWLYASYALSLSVRDSVKCRRLIESPWYQAAWGPRFQLTSDVNLKTRFENDATGYRIATSVGGSATGEGGDRIVCDDPHAIDEVESATIREGTLTWWDETMSTRGNNPATVAYVIVMQRTHASDLAGHVLEQGGYHHLNLPAEYEPRPAICCGRNPDPRSEPGELLWPEQFDRAAVDGLKVRLGPVAAAGQLQQRPVPRGGAMFKREWFPIVDAAPAAASRVRYWDKAGTAGGGKFTAGVLMSRDERGLYTVEDVVRGQWSAGDRRTVMLQTAAADADRAAMAVAVWLEQEPGSGGKESAETSIRDLAGYDVHAETVTGPKEVRAGPFAAQAQAGNVRLLHGPWNMAYLDELTLFPRGPYSDQVDGSSGAFNKLALARQPKRVAVG